MVKKDTVKYYAAPTFFILMLLDGQFTRLLENWSRNYYIANAHLLLLGLMCGCMVLSKRYMLITSVVLGMLFDMYYVGVLGIYMVALPLSVWLMYALADTLYRNVFTMFFGMIIFVTLFELVTLSIQMLFKLADVSDMFFISRFLGPTLLINMLLFIIFIFPFKKLFVIE